MIALLVPKWAARPFALQIAGSWKRAAAEWSRLGCPYEEARALAEGDIPAQMRALEAFDALGAAPAAAFLRQRLRAAGVRRIPRGRRASTRKNPFGLTMRELETLGGIARGLSNSRIGAELHISAKTVDHHVSAVLAKLGATLAPGGGEDRARAAPRRARWGGCGRKIGRTSRCAQSAPMRRLGAQWPHWPNSRRSIQCPDT